MRASMDSPQSSPTNTSLDPQSSLNSASPNARTGRTFDGKFHFVVPKTKDIVESHINPANWGPVELLSLVTVFFVILSLFLKLPIYFYVLQYLFWRASYNIGLGYILHKQSQSAYITNWLKNTSPAGKKMLRKLISHSMGPDYKWSKTPPEFNAWIVFRVISTAILTNDGISYLVLCIKLFTPRDPNVDSIFFIAFCYFAGIALVVFSYWSKVSAHKVVGDFAWHWGDFFFLLDGELIFDGVFELFPHPMYTVGYAGYYGLSLIARSYKLLFVSLLGHIMQMCFLFFVEEPHIDKIYAPKSCDDSKIPDLSDKEESLDGNSASPTAIAIAPSYPEQKPLVTLINFDWSRPSDLLVALLIAQHVFTVLFFSRSSNASFFIFQFAVARIFHTFGLGAVLYFQSKNNFWTNELTNRGLSAQRAFDLWKVIFNSSFILNQLAVISMVVTCVPFPFEKLGDIFHMKPLSYIIGAFALGVISYYAMFSAYDVIGDFGYFYGDFFMPRKSDVPSYIGLYRYINNPACFLGYSAYYGLALLYQSWDLFWLFLAIHVIELAFALTVEVGHMERCYEYIRDAAGLERSIRNHAQTVVTKVPLVNTLAGEIKLRVVKSRDVLFQDSTQILKEKAVSITEKVNAVRSDILQDIKKLRQDLIKHNIVLEAQRVGTQAKERIKNIDEELFVLLENSGMMNFDDLSDDENTIPLNFDKSPTLQDNIAPKQPQSDSKP